MVKPSSSSFLERESLVKKKDIFETQFCMYHEILIKKAQF